MPSLLFLARPAAAAESREQIDLNGEWEFRLDPLNAGLQQKWFAPSERFTDSINVPGAWQAQGFGEPSGILRHNYEGPAWYRRTVSVPETWRAKRTVLHIGGTHRRVRAFVNGVELGGHDGFSAPFEFDISSAIKPGSVNVIVLRIENPPVTIEASPDKQKPLLPTGMLNYIGNWGGIYGAVELRSTPRTYIKSVLIIPDVEQRRISFRVRIDSAENPRPVTLSVEAAGSAASVDIPAAKLDSDAVVGIPAPNAPQWSPDDPQLLTARIRLLDRGEEIDRKEERFGFRQFTTRGSTLLLNGKPLYLRGYGDDNVEVLTGFPPSSRKVILGTC
jgi:beta-galactosidase/beta-glucuronidase